MDYNLKIGISSVMTLYLHKQEGGWGTHAWIVHNRNMFCLNALKLTFPVVYNFTCKQHRIRHNEDIYITSEMALV